MNEGSMIGRYTRFLHHCRTTGFGDAGRRLREERETERIRRERAGGIRLTPEEKQAQERAVFSQNIRFDVETASPGNEPSEQETVLQSLKEQTYQNYRTGQTEDTEWAVFLEPDGRLHPGALYECAREIRDHDADLIYTDEAYYSTSPGDPDSLFFKPDYGPDSLRGSNYIGPFFVCRRALLEAAGAENYAELDADAQWDAVVRIAEKAKQIRHIPKVLYYRSIHHSQFHDRCNQNSNRNFDSYATIHNSFRRIREEIKGTPLVSILIANKDHREDLQRCVDSIREKTTYPDYEIIIIENNSTEKETFAYYEELKKDGRIRVVSREGAFNYSAVNNLGAREAKGEMILLLNNDTEVISPDWIQEMLMYAQRQDVGAVGAKLYYPDGTIQHAGIGIGITIAAGHYFRGFPGDSDGYYGRLKYAQNVSAVTAACMMIPRKVYEEMHGLDENFSVVFNDVDLCLRIREAGYLIVWTPQAELKHYEGKSRGADLATPEKKKFFVRETNRFLRRWWRVLEKGDPYYNVNLTRQAEDFSLR